MLFSERMGFREAKVNMQLDSMDSALRVALWNALQAKVLAQARVDAFTYKSPLRFYFAQLWDEYFKMTVDSVDPHYDRNTAFIKRYFFEAEWHSVYDFLEFTAKTIPREFSLALAGALNPALEREASGFRFIDKIFTPISNIQEIESIESSINSPATPSMTVIHLQAALSMLSDRAAPDYRNSIKESISAVESISQAITRDPKASLGDALKALERNGVMHPALKKSLSALYGYTSDAEGIRHSLIDEPNLAFADAKFMLVACTAFVNLMIEKSAQNSSPT